MNLVRLVASRKGRAPRMLAIPARQVSVTKADQDVPLARSPRLRAPGLAGYTVRFYSDGDAVTWALQRLRA